MQWGCRSTWTRWARCSSPRWPGSFGAAYLYFVVPRVILFREEHTPRVFVDKVDFVSAPGTSEEGVHRTGGPVALLTGKGLFSFDRRRARFTLESVHPGHDLAQIRAATGFGFDHAAAPRQTPQPDAATLGVLRGRVLDELSETYPDFAERMRADLAAPAAEAARLDPSLQRFLDRVGALAVPTDRLPAARSLLNVNTPADAAAASRGRGRGEPRRNA